MRLATARKPLIADDSFESHDFTIEAEDSAHIISMLSDKLYSDKILAVCREYMANAFDACVEAGTNRPIEITVPNQLNPIFAVRDFGLGLSKDDVLNVFIKMGKSTKRDSNNVVGAFGIGGKAFRAYGDAMNVISIYDGVKTVYTAQKTDNGGNRLFVISSMATDEPSGVEISLAVNPKDIREFEDKIINLSRFFEVRPILKGTSRKVPDVTKNIIGNEWYGYEGQNYYSNKAFVLMGNIPYPVDIGFLNYDEKSFLQSVLHSYNIVFQSGIGKVDISPDREKLEYTPKTKTFLASMGKRIKKDFVESFKKSVVSAPTYSDALNLVINRERSVIETNDIKGLKWNGRDIVYVLNKLFDDYKVSMQKAYDRNGRIKKNDFPKWEYHEDFVILIDDGVSLVNKRIKGYFNNVNDSNITYNGVYVVSGEEGNIKKFLAAINSDLFSKEKIVWLKNVTPEKIDRDSGNSKAHIKVFSFDYKSSYRIADKWKKVEKVDDKKIKYFVPIMRFQWEKGSMDVLHNYHDFFRSVLKKDIEIYGVRVRDVEGLDDTWVEFTKELFEAEYDKWFNKIDNEFLETLCETEIDFTVGSIKKYFSSYTGAVKEFIDKVERVKTLCKKYEKEIRVMGIIQPHWRDEFKKGRKNSTAEIENRIKKDYPMLKSFIDRGWFLNDSDVKRYISLENIAKEVDKTP